MQAVFGVNFIADHLKQQEEFNKVRAHVFICSRVYVFTCSFVHVFGCSRVYVFTCSFVHVFVCSRVYVFTCSCIHVFTCSCVHVFTCSCVHLTHAFKMIQRFMILYFLNNFLLFTNINN